MVTKSKVPYVKLTSEPITVTDFPELLIDPNNLLESNNLIGTASNVNKGNIVEIGTDIRTGNPAFEVKGKCTGSAKDDGENLNIIAEYSIVEPVYFQWDAKSFERSKWSSSISKNPTTKKHLILTGLGWTMGAAAAGYVGYTQEDIVGSSGRYILPSVVGLGLTHTYFLSRRFNGKSLRSNTIKTTVMSANPVEFADITNQELELSFLLDELEVSETTASGTTTTFLIKDSVLEERSIDDPIGTMMVEWKGEKWPICTVDVGTSNLWVSSIDTRMKDTFSAINVSPDTSLISENYKNIDAQRNIAHDLFQQYVRNEGWGTWCSEMTKLIGTNLEVNEAPMIFNEQYISALNIKFGGSSENSETVERCQTMQTTVHEQTKANVSDLVTNGQFAEAVKWIESYSSPNVPINSNEIVDIIHQSAQTNFNKQLNNEELGLAKDYLQFFYVEEDKEAAQSQMHSAAKGKYAAALKNKKFEEAEEYLDFYFNTEEEELDRVDLYVAEFNHLVKNGEYTPAKEYLINFDASNRRIQSQPAMDKNEESKTNATLQLQKAAKNKFTQALKNGDYGQAQSYLEFLLVQDEQNMAANQLGAYCEKMINKYLKEGKYSKIFEVVDTSGTANQSLKQCYQDYGGDSFSGLINAKKGTYHEAIRKLLLAKNWSSSLKKSYEAYQLLWYLNDTNKLPDNKGTIYTFKEFSEGWDSFGDSDLGKILKISQMVSFIMKQPAIVLLEETYYGDSYYTVDEDYWEDIEGIQDEELNDLIYKEYNKRLGNEVKAKIQKYRFGEASALIDSLKGETVQEAYLLMLESSCRTEIKNLVGKGKLEEALEALNVIESDSNSWRRLNALTFKLQRDIYWKQLNEPLEKIRSLAVEIDSLAQRAAKSNSNSLEEKMMQKIEELEILKEDSEEQIEYAYEELAELYSVMEAYEDDYDIDVSEIAGFSSSNLYWDLKSLE
jgi:hypothetical protein